MTDTFIILFSMWLLTHPSGKNDQVKSEEPFEEVVYMWTEF